MNTPDTPRTASGTLTPARAVYVYALAFLLMVFLDAGRLSAMLERDMPSAAVAGKIISSIADVSGLTAFSQAERGIIESLTSEQSVGARPARHQPSTPSAASAVPATPIQLKSTPAAQKTDALKSAPSVPQPDPNTVVPQAQPTSEMPQVSPPVADQTERKPRVLLIGDSMMMEGFGPVLQRALRSRPDMEVIKEGRYSTGLSRADYFDWPSSLKELMTKYAPDLVVICMGANDPQDILEKSKRHHADSESWRELYQARAEQLLDVATAQGSRVVWMGLPIMSKEPYATRVKRLTRLQKTACDKNERAQFVDSSAVLADAKGAYTTFLTDTKGKHVRLRYKDMVHVTEDGGRLLTTNLIPYIEQALELKKRDDANRPPSVETAADKRPGALPDIAANATSSLATNPAAHPTTVVPVVPATSATSASSVSANAARLTGGERPTIAVTQPQLLRMFSAARNKEVPYLAYIPAAHSGVSVREERFPVLYLLHGAYEDFSVWDKRAGNLLQSLANKHRIVLIAPSCEPFGWYADSPRLPSSQIERFILTELIPHVEEHLPVLQIRGAAGMSMGGHGAFTLGLRHPGIFASLSSMSGVMDITKHANQWKIKDVLGPAGATRKLWEAYSAQHLLTVTPSRLAPAMLVTTGTDDALVLQENRVFRDTLRKGGFTYQYREVPGGHDWTYWTSELPQHVAFHASHLR